MSKIGVSVICTAYNHEKYIRDALNGFIMQKTDFPIEVLVHDDASTDNTTEIIKEYEAKYPDLIHGIYETENLYSKGGDIFWFIEKAKGKYIALCEGDDYWTDSMKLQRQYEALEAHPECDVCAHEAVIMAGKKKIGRVAPSKKNTVFSAETVILGNGGFVSTCSLFLKTSYMKSNSALHKRSRYKYDYLFQIGASLRGGMVYLSIPMSVYRKNVSNSWSIRNEAENFATCWCQMYEMLNEVDNQIYEETNGRFSDSLRQMKEYYQFLISDSMEKAGEFYKRENKGAISFIPLKNRLRYFLWAKVPCLMKAKKKISEIFGCN